MLKSFVIATVLSATLIGTSFAFWQESTPSRSSSDRGSGSGPTGFPFFPPAAPIVTLLRTPEVQKELKLDEDKAKTLDEINAEIARERTRLNAEFSAKMNELSKKTDGDALALLNDAQCRRTEQLRLQQQGLRPLSTDAVAEKLGLTKTRFVGCGRVIETHQENLVLMGLDDSTHPTVSQCDRDPSSAPSERTQRLIEESNKRAGETREKILAVLTPEQKTKWSEMTGEPFKFPTPQWPAPRGTSTRSSEPAKPGAEKKDQ